MDAATCWPIYNLLSLALAPDDNLVARKQRNDLIKAKGSRKEESRRRRWSSASTSGCPHTSALALDIVRYSGFPIQ